MTLTQWQFSYNGLTLGAGTPYGLKDATGLRELAPQRSSDTPRGRQDGSAAGRQYSDERVIQMTWIVTAAGGMADYMAALEAIGTAFAPIPDPSQQLPFLFWPGAISIGRPVQITCRPTKGGVPTDKSQSIGFTSSLAVELTCNDPLIYDSQLSSSSCGLPSPTAGLTFPVAFPVSFGASTGGSLSVTTVGNVPTAPVFTIAGPCTNPTITCNGATLGFTIALGAGDSLVVDCRARTAILNGTASRNNLITGGSSWLSLPPTATTSVGFASSDATQVTGTLTCAYRSAWNWL